jgi:hypothetical protein
MTERPHPSPAPQPPGTTTSAQPLKGLETHAAHWPGRPAWWPIRPPLEAETRTHLDTASAAFHLGRRPQTLRIWAMGRKDAPLRPVRINGRLAWSVADIRRVLSGGKP